MIDTRERAQSRGLKKRRSDAATPKEFHRTDEAGEILCVVNNCRRPAICRVEFVGYEPGDLRCGQHALDITDRYPAVVLQAKGWTG